MAKDALTFASMKRVFETVGRCESLQKTGGDAFVLQLPRMLFVRRAILCASFPDGSSSLFSTGLGFFIGVRNFMTNRPIDFFLGNKRKCPNIAQFVNCFLWTRTISLRCPSSIRDFFLVTIRHPTFFSVRPFHGSDCGFHRNRQLVYFSVSTKAITEFGPWNFHSLLPGSHMFGFRIKATFSLHRSSIEGNIRFGIVVPPDWDGQCTSKALSGPFCWAPHLPLLRLLYVATKRRMKGQAITRRCSREYVCMYSVL